MGSSFEKAFFRQGFEQGVWEGVQMAVDIMTLYCQGLSEEEIVARTKYDLKFVEKCIARFDGIIPQKSASAVP